MEMEADCWAPSSQGEGTFAAELNAFPASQKCGAVLMNLRVFVFFLNKVEIWIFTWNLLIFKYGQLLD